MSKNKNYNDVFLNSLRNDEKLMKEQFYSGFTNIRNRLPQIDQLTFNQFIPFIESVNDVLLTIVDKEMSSRAVDQDFLMTTLRELSELLEQASEQDNIIWAFEYGRIMQQIEEIGLLPEERTELITHVRCLMKEMQKSSAQSAYKQGIMDTLTYLQSLGNVESAEEFLNEHQDKIMSSVDNYFENIDNYFEKILTVCEEHCHYCSDCASKDD